MAAQLRWHGEELKKQLAKATSEGLLRAGTFYHARCQQAVSRPNTGRSVPVKRQTPGGNRRTRTIYPNPSKPGEPPRLRTGFGRSNIVMNHKGGKKPYVRVGVTRNGMYMFYLELGTRHVKRRPWLLKTLFDNRAVIGKLAATGGSKLK